MKRVTHGLAALALVFAGSVTAGAADDSPRAIIERAIKAHGGQARMEKLKMDRVTLKGTMFVNGKKSEFTAETIVNLPSQFRNVVQLMRDNRQLNLVQILDGEKAIVTLDGQPQTVAGSALTEMRETLNLERATRLTALLKDKSFTLAPLEDSKVKDKPVVGVKVSTKDHSELKLYFAKDTGLLIKTEHILTVDGRQVTQEEHYSDFKVFDGYKRPTKLVVFRQGDKLMEAELVDVKYLDKVDETLFKKP